MREGWWIKYICGKMEDRGWRIEDRGESDDGSLSLEQEDEG